MVKRSHYDYKIPWLSIWGMTWAIEHVKQVNTSGFDCVDHFVKIVEFSVNRILHLTYP